MLPLQMAGEVRAAVLEYIYATFRCAERETRTALRSLLTDPARGLMRGPYLRLHLPFAPADAAEPAPLEVMPPFRPHLHQQKAFSRLTSQGGHRPVPTLLTTGTGSGKTECFLYPILDHVRRVKAEGAGRGVKAIIMYPMNALATDQAGRLAAIIYADERLRGTVTAGLFIGIGGRGSDLPTDMGADHIIEDREQIRLSAPDILLTNFKMLDYALMREEYMPLWAGNIDTEAPMLRYLVLDELHTYDGAQGTDVANLVRRLKLKLGMPPQGALTPVGTSATLGTGPDAVAELGAYAADIFGEEFAPESVIGETRLSADEMFGGEGPRQEFVPKGGEFYGFAKRAYATGEAYVQAWERLWLGTASLSPTQLGARLLRLRAVRELAEVCAGEYMTLPQIAEALAQRSPLWAALRRGSPAMAEVGVASLAALIAAAQRPGAPGRPLMQSQAVLWMRELSGVQRVVSAGEPQFRWRDEAVRDGTAALPVWFCRDCGANGWITRALGRDAARYDTSARRVGEHFMGHYPDVRLLTEPDAMHAPHPDYTGTAPANQAEVRTVLLRPQNLEEAAQGEAGAVPVRMMWRTRMGDSSERFAPICPHCMGENMAIMGQKMTTLSSVGVSGVMASDMDDDTARKMLTFTNSVQDAAHLAALYEHRTFRFLMRQSIQEYLLQGPGAGRPQSLKEVQEGFCAYWKGKLKGDEYYYRFMPDEYADVIDLSRDYRGKDGELTAAFRAEFDTRMAWEIGTEYGYMSGIGRTLEKAGSSGVLFDAAKIAAVAAAMKPWLEENNLLFAAQNARALERFITGLLHRMRRRGAVDHPYMEMYRRTLNAKMINWTEERRSRHFLYKSLGGRKPMVLAVEKLRGSEDADTTFMDTRRTWHHQYFVKCLIDDNRFAINDFYAALCAEMTRAGLLDEARSQRGRVNYAIRPEALYISAPGAAYQCDVCHAPLHVAAADRGAEGVRCLEFACTGSYASTPVEPNYYTRIYASPRSPRLRAHEHTGLLERAEREKVERSFRDTASPDALNLLTATSTLEMGIDIGDLNVVCNAGVPPTVAGYQQRTGRGGRRTGAGLVINYTGASRHDRFFFADPGAMMQGEVTTPGCFLEASDILRRHFYAYCIDTWTNAGVDTGIPPKVRLLPRQPAALGESRFFINRINSFIDAHIEELTRAFAAQYPPTARSAVESAMADARRGMLQRRVLDVFRRLQERRAELAQAIKDSARQLEQTPQNDETRRRELTDRLRSLRAVRRQLDITSVIEYMTDQGALPNYGFPETGIKLTATIVKPQLDGSDSGKRAKPEVVETMRSASQGIRDLAPGARFYTRKMALEVQAVAVKADDLKRMRYCSQCDAVAIEGEEGYAALVCPKCGHASWRANEHAAVRFTEAESYMRRRDAAIRDRDEREREPYAAMKHFRYEPMEHPCSYSLPEQGFGIEFAPGVELTEVNYGDRQGEGEHAHVAGQEVPERGFVVCRHCGRATAKYNGRTKVEDLHFPYCRHRETPYPVPADKPEEADTFSELYLYRRMHTEALKILVPVTHTDDGKTTALYKAIVQLGLRLYYRSSPEHLAVEEYREYNAAHQEMDTYLVIYDTIPGGTGYLKKLARPEAFTRLLRLAYEHLRDCECQHEGKSVCYRCLLTYAGQWGAEGLTRLEGLQALTPLINRSGEWQRLSAHLGAAALQGPDTESALERAFRAAMSAECRRRAWTWEEDAEDPEHFILTMLDEASQSRVVYDVQAQYHLGPSTHVERDTVPDFFFTCRSARHGGQEVDVSETPQVALYLDGLAYHAGPEHMNFYGDVEKRRAIRAATAPAPLWSWTLTWHDVIPYAEPELGEKEAEYALPDKPKVKNRAILRRFPTPLVEDRTPLEQLFSLLMLPSLMEQREAVFGYLAAVSAISTTEQAPPGDVERAIAEDATTEYASAVSKESLRSLRCFLRTSMLTPTELVHGSAWLNLNSREIRYDFKLAEGLTAIERSDFRAFWGAYNLLQFFTEAAAPVEAAPEADIDEIRAMYPDRPEAIEALLSVGLMPDTEFELEVNIDGENNDLSDAVIKIKGHPVVLIDGGADARITEALRQRGLTPVDFAQAADIKEIINRLP